MTLITLQTFESEFYLRSLPCAFSRQLTFVLVALFFLLLLTMFKRLPCCGRGYQNCGHILDRFSVSVTPKSSILGLVSFQQFGFSGSATIFSLNNIGPESENISDLSTSVIPRSRRD